MRIPRWVQWVAAWTAVLTVWAWYPALWIYFTAQDFADDMRKDMFGE